MSRRIGIEVSATAVRIAELELGSRPKLTAFVEQALPHGSVVDGVVIERDVVREAIANCVAAGHFRRRHLGSPVKAHLSITGLRAITREIEMPRVPDSELDSAVRLQALDVVPFPVDSAVLSARRLSEDEADETTSDRVMLAAAHRDLIDPVVEAMAQAGMVALSVDFAPFALVRSLADPTQEGPEAIVSIGADLTTVVVHYRGEPQLVRTIAGGGASVTRAIAAAIDVPFADAEAMKLRLGEGEADVHLPLEAVTAARDSSMALLAEIRSSIQYYSTLRGRRECTNVVLTGGGALLSGLQERLAEQLPVPISSRGCLHRLETSDLRVADPDRIDTTGAVVIGTALPGSPGSKAINLLPPEVVASRRQQRVEHAVALGAVGVVVVLAGLGAARFVQVHSANARVATLHQSIQVLEGQVPKYDQVAAEDAQLLSDSALAEPLVSHEVNWPAVLEAIDTYTPSGVAASNFTGTSTAPATAANPSVAASPSPALPTPKENLGTVNLSFSGPAYPAFKTWFNSVSGSNRLAIVEFSGVTSSGSGVTFSAQLSITGSIVTDRLTRFEIGALHNAS